MNAAHYQGIKVVIGTTAAIAIAEMLNLSYATTAGIIALLSILATKSETYQMGMKRTLGSGMALAIAGFLFAIWDHQIIVFGVFMLVFVLLAMGLNLQGSISVGTVLVTHLYTIQTVNLSVIANEFALLAIGVFMGFLLNIHMISEITAIRQSQKECEKWIKDILYQMAAQLENKCSLEEAKDSLERLDAVISNGFKLSVTYEQNNPLKDMRYYPNYFRMRREQYFLLKYMERHFHLIFITVVEAKMLSEFTMKLADELNENNDGLQLLEALSQLRSHYKSRPLPENREAFENRATLFQYMNDLETFIHYKTSFVLQKTNSDQQ